MSEWMAITMIVGIALVVLFVLFLAVMGGWVLGNAIRLYREVMRGYRQPIVPPEDIEWWRLHGTAHDEKEHRRMHREAMEEPEEDKRD